MTWLSFSVIFSFFIASAVAFAPNVHKSNGVATDLSALSRRDAVGLAFTGLVAGLVPEVASAATAATVKGQESFTKSNFDMLVAANPALETFKGRKRTRGSFTPGKGYVLLRFCYSTVVNTFNLLILLLCFQNPLNRQLKTFIYLQFPVVESRACFHI
jgi:hypothetical protein